MTSDATPGLAAELAAIHDRSERPVPGVTALPISNPAVQAFMASAADVPPLLAAVEAALALHGREPSGDPAVTNHWCQDCSFAWPCRTYRAISAALTGKDADDAH